MIDFNDYQRRAITTKIYANEVGIPYIALGIVGEVGEFIEKLWNNENEEDILLTKEVGDIYWYLAGFFSELNSNMGEHIQYTNVLLEDDKVIEIITLNPSKIAELTKKYLRDEYPNNMSTNRFEKIVNIIQDLHDALYTLCINYDINLEEILETNIVKLQSRKERGVLGGDGDSR